MNKTKCPICGLTGTCSQQSVPGFNEHVICNHYGFNCLFDSEFLEIDDGNEEKEKVIDLIVEFLLRNDYCCSDHKKTPWKFLFDPNFQENEPSQPQNINMAEYINSYPKNVVELTNRALYNLSIRFPEYGTIIHPCVEERRTVFDHKGVNNKYDSVFEMLADLGFLKEQPNSENKDYKISVKGWDRIATLQHTARELQQAFVAMSFGKETCSIREAFRNAITDSGYSIRIIDEKEHNNQIVPEILYEIQRSKFVVVDVTFPNYGAYYEAGYAQALGKEVIICCKEDSFHSKDTRPHFDIAQKAMIVWKDENDLIVRLKRRIEATIK